MKNKQEGRLRILHQCMRVRPLHVYVKVMCVYVFTSVCVLYEKLEEIVGIYGYA